MNAQKGILRIIKVSRILVFISAVIGVIKIIQYFPNSNSVGLLISALKEWHFVTDHNNPDPFFPFRLLSSLPAIQWLGICLATVLLLKAVIWVLRGLLDDESYPQKPVD